MSNELTDSFFGKLKEQSFTIILLVIILYYQNYTYNNQLTEYKTMINDKEQLILKLTDDERMRLLERTQYLLEQRDKYVDQLISERNLIGSNE
ncbi:hypothetical protein UFOVP1307_154 [uncultured Caudovirales phage]|uniref:Uncharacterized protein n=1 Tax=uncultured Caudovirales phage TaxID=2100421 RepID=A0A6J5N989_9CAUD|nr:hypothetical protein UFOVP651_192 [uncultured Caudovirales phage]CAB4170541.1 hypothetical protein UFOVP902_48 [uncultured Caudovirales phage]CAB4198567.1 hypothetical protein UFOVP1307_154 [uncultured Caudovirales phage]